MYIMCKDILHVGIKYVYIIYSIYIYCTMFVLKNTKVYI